MILFLYYLVCCSLVVLMFRITTTTLRQGKVALKLSFGDVDPIYWIHFHRLGDPFNALSLYGMTDLRFKFLLSLELLGLASVYTSNTNITHKCTVLQVSKLLP